MTLLAFCLLQNNKRKTVAVGHANWTIDTRSRWWPCQKRSFYEYFVLANAKRAWSTASSVTSAAKILIKRPKTSALFSGSKVYRGWDLGNTLVRANNENYLKCWFPWMYLQNGNYLQCWFPWMYLHSTALIYLIYEKENRKLFNLEAPQA